MDTPFEKTPARPLMRYFGGKWRAAPRIIEHFPPHRCYVEPFGGAASVLLQKKRAYAEVYNDLDGEIVNLFRVVRDHGDELLRRMELTPYAREEFDTSFTLTDDPIEQARRTITRSLMGFGSTFTRANADNSPTRTGWRTYTGSNRHTLPAHDFAKWPESLPAIIDRLRGVVIEQKPAVEVLRLYDDTDVLHYVDPPYVHSTRQPEKSGKVNGYRHEMTDDDHRELATVLRSLKGAVIVSGYACDLYDCELYRDWRRVRFGAYANCAAPRAEVLWMHNVPPNQPTLF